MTINASISVGRGGWKLTWFQVPLLIVPRVGERFSFDGDGPTASVRSVSVTPSYVYIGLDEGPASLAGWRESRQEWLDAAKRNGYPPPDYDPSAGEL